MLNPWSCTEMKLSRLYIWRSIQKYDFIADIRAYIGLLLMVLWREKCGCIHELRMEISRTQYNFSFPLVYGSDAEHIFSLQTTALWITLQLSQNNLDDSYVSQWFEIH